MARLGRLRRLVGPVPVVAVAVLLGLRGVVEDTPCRIAASIHDWARATATCRIAGARDPEDQMRYAWALYYGGGDRRELLAVVDALRDTSADADARYLAGQLRAQRDDEDDRARGRELLQEALTRYAARGDAAGAARASCDLSRMGITDRHFDVGLARAHDCAMYATVAGNARLRRHAMSTLATAYDRTGRAVEAGEAFQDAAAQAAPWPDDLAWVRFNYATHLLDLRDRETGAVALAYLAAAEASVAEAQRRGQHGAVSALPVAIALNRATALSFLDRNDEAAAALATVPATLTDDARVQMVAGVLAAKRGDRALASRLLAAAGAADIDPDYAVTIAVELAHLDRAAGRNPEAEQWLRRGIEVVERVRRNSRVELRSWILAHRAGPYHELLAMLAADGRMAEALAVIETLHARAWRDAASAIDSLESLDGAALLELAGDRELLIYLDVGARTWRAHVHDRRVEVGLLPETAAVAIERFRWSPNDADAARVAAAALLPPALTATDAPLYVVATGRAAEIPFPALRLDEGALIERRPLARLPGMVALRCGGGPWTDAVVLVGDATRDLPAAAEEIATLARQFGGARWVGVAATRDRVRSARNATLLHVAVHGSVDADGGRLALADGILTSADVVAQRIGPRTVVLAGCSTSASRDAETWGAFPSAFLASGSRYVVATARPLPDADAAAMMRLYYAQPDHLDPIRRLAAAQRAALATMPAKTWAIFSAWGVADCAP